MNEEFPRMAVEIHSSENRGADMEDDLHEDSERRELVTAGDADEESCGSEKTLRAPSDTYQLVYILFYLFGITSLIPWNFLITANDYWMYKFRDVTPSNGTITLGKTRFQAEFTSYLNVATAVPNLIFLILNSIFGHLVSLNRRLMGSLMVIITSFVVTTVFVQIDTDDMQSDFFIITIVLVVVMTAASAIFIGGLFGIAGKFPSEYMAAVVSGQSLGGIIAAIAQILSLAFKISPLHSALIYFLIADLLVLVSMASYLGMTKLNFFKHYMFRSAGGLALNRHRSASTFSVLKKIWVYCFSIFSIFAISMAVYPAVTVLVESHPATKGTDWNVIFFVPVVNYLIFNCGDYSGRLVAGFLLKPENQWVIAAGSLLRIVGVPMLMLCNAQPRKHLPVVFEWDYEYIIIMIIFAFTNGYLTNITFINSTKDVEPHEKEKASSIIATMLSMGLCLGAAIGMLLVRLL